MKRDVPNTLPKPWLRVAWTATLGLLLALPVIADPVTYTYTGQDFTNLATYGSGYSTSDFVSVSLTLASPLGPDVNETIESDDILSWTVSDQVVTYSSALGNYLADAQFATNAEGVPIEWDVVASSSEAEDDDGQFVETEGYPPPYTGSSQDASEGDVGTTGFAYNEGDPGSWSEGTGPTTPEPGTLALLLLGLGAGTLKHRRSKAHVAGLWTLSFGNGDRA
jgi:hypothetical protein